MTLKEIREFVKGLPGKRLPSGFKVLRITRQYVKIKSEEGIILKLTLENFEKEFILPILKNKKQRFLMKIKTNNHE